MGDFTSFNNSLYENAEASLGKLGGLATLPTRGNFSIDQRNNLNSYLIPAVYSQLEGFFRETSRTYIRAIETAELLNYGSLEPRFFAILFGVNFFERDPFDRDKGDWRITVKPERMQTLACELAGFVQGRSIFEGRVSRKEQIPISNINFARLNKLLENLCVDPLQNRQLQKFDFDQGLDKLLGLRNAIAHEGKSRLIDENEFNGFINLVTDVIYELAVLFEKAIKERSFLRQAVTAV